MKKKILHILIALMSFSLIGIVWVQVYWIQNGISVKEAQFDQLVNDALNHVVTNLDDNESIVFISDQLNNVTSDLIVNKDSSNNVKKIKKCYEKTMGLRYLLINRDTSNVKYRSGRFEDKTLHTVREKARDLLKKRSHHVSSKRKFHLKSKSGLSFGDSSNDVTVWGKALDTQGRQKNRKYQLSGRLHKSFERS